jgi:2Fe-2S ferredoxin
MIRIEVQLRSGETQTVEAAALGTLKQALMDGGVGEINALTSCGGAGSCRTCHVYIDPPALAKLAPMQPSEDALLSLGDDRRPNSRLSCQVRLTEAMDVLALTIAPEW